MMHTNICVDRVEMSSSLGQLWGNCCLRAEPPLALGLDFVHQSAKPRLTHHPQVLAEIYDDVHECVLVDFITVEYVGVCSLYWTY